jgi:opacity protein-like surface antigen
MLAAAGALTVQIGGALAADMPGRTPIDEPPAADWFRTPTFNLNYGWYLRGDVGYNWGRLSGAESAPGFLDPTDDTLGNGVVAGIGAGIKTRWLRTDFTVDYSFPLDYQGTIATPGDVTAKIAATTVLFNAYLDLGTWYNITPYIGAGAGVSYVGVSDYASTLAPPFTGDANNSQWNFTWAVMTGFGVAVAPNLIVDVNYRYIDFGDVSTASDTFGAMTFKDVAAHEVRAGLRYSFDDLKAQSW